MRRRFVFGDSHASDLFGCAQVLGRGDFVRTLLVSAPLFHAPFFELFDGRARFLDPTAPYWDLARSSLGIRHLEDLPPRSLVLSVGLSPVVLYRHPMWQTKEGRYGIAGDARKGRTIVSGAVVAQMAADMQRHAVAFYEHLFTHDLVAATIAAPDPQDAHPVVPALGRSMVRELVRQHEAPVRDCLARHDVVPLKVPEASDDEGFLRPQYAGADPAHAGHRYMTRLIELVDAECVRRAPRRTAAGGDGLVLTHDTRVAAIGDGFARTLGEGLRSRGCDVLDAEPGPLGLRAAPAGERYGYRPGAPRAGRIASAGRLVQLVEEALGRAPSVDVAIEREGRWYDGRRPDVEPGGLPDAATVLAHRADHLSRVRRLFEELDLLVFTLGATEVWVGERDGGILDADPGGSGYVRLEVGPGDVARELAALRVLVAESSPAARMLLTTRPGAPTWLDDAVAGFAAGNGGVDHVGRTDPLRAAVEAAADPPSAADAVWQRYGVGSLGAFGTERTEKTADGKANVPLRPAPPARDGSVCLIGDLRAGMLAETARKRALWPRLTAVVAPGGLLAELRQQDGELVAETDGLAALLRARAGGCDRIVPRDYSAFALVGLITVEQVASLYARHRLLSDAGAPGEHALMSEAVLHDAIAGLAEDCLGVRLIRLLRQTTSAPIAWTPTPLLQVGAREKPEYAPRYADPTPLHTALTVFEKALRKVCAELDVVLVSQPADTVVDGAYTAAAFALTADQPVPGSRSLKASDPFNVNAEFSARRLDQLARALA